MCGRARCTVRPQDIPAACGIRGGARTIDADRFRPSYNISPGHYMPIARCEHHNDGSEVVVHCMKWGLVPSFTKKSEKPDHFRMFNARSESVHEKASFRRLLGKCRCLVIVEGFYEWKKDGAKKQPFYVHFQDGRPLIFAALYDHWEDKEGNLLYTFTILTTRSSKGLEWLHDRMPVILGNHEAANAWLNQEHSGLSIEKLAVPYDGLDLIWYPVTPAMGKITFDGSDCIKEIRAKAEGSNSIAHHFSKRNQSGNTQKTLSTHSHDCMNDEEKKTAISEQEFPSGYDLSDQELKALVAAMEPDEHTKEKIEVISSEDKMKHQNSQGEYTLVEDEMKESIGVLDKKKLAHESSHISEANKKRDRPANVECSEISPVGKQSKLTTFFGRK